MKALTVGGATIDTIAIIESERVEQLSMRNAESSFLMIQEGHKTEALDISAGCGGGAANSAVALSRLGFEVSALIKTGDDHRADEVARKLAAEDVSLRWVRRDGRAPTGASVLISSHDRNAAVFTFRGANTLLELADLADQAFAVDLVHVANLSNRSVDCYPAIVKKAKANGALVATNPGVRQLSAQTAAFLDNLPLVDILVLNREEADTLVASLARETAPVSEPLGSTGPAGQRPPRLAVRGLMGGGYAMSLRTFLRGIAARGPSHVVLTDGSEGAFVATASEILYAKARKIYVAGTAGAGDAFASTYAAFIASGRAPSDALRAATINSASVLGYVDTQSGLMRLEDLEALLMAGKSDPDVMTWPL